MKRHKDTATFGHDPLNTELQFATKLLIYFIIYREAHSRPSSEEITQLLWNRKV